MNFETVTGTIFNIQKFSVHDGPGIRTAVFLKGCNLSCLWCHNPESISRNRQVEFYPERCIGCGKCMEVCPTGAQRFDPITGEHVIDRERCTGCLSCAGVCYAEALVGVGSRIAAGEVLRRILDDKPYYDQSGGGVTFSGGECMLQPEFLYAMLSLCKRNGVHTAVDTAGNVPQQWLENILPVTDLFLYDVKAADEEVHRRLTGAGNRLILENLRFLCRQNARVIVRVPVIGGYNDGEMEGISELLRDLPVELVEFLPYHKLGGSKYAALDLPQRAGDAKVPSAQRMDQLVADFQAKGIPASHT